MILPTHQLRLLPLLLALGLALVAGTATCQALSLATQTVVQTPTATVVLTTRALAVGALLSEDDLRQVEVPEDIVPEDAIRDMAEATGQYVRLSTLAGEIVQRSQLSLRPPGSQLSTVVPEGHLAVSIAVSDTLSSSGLISPGDHVDVLGILSHEPGSRAEVVLRDVMVLAVGETIIGIPSDAEGNAKGSGAANLRTVTITLAVTEPQARSLVQVDDTGRLRLAIRPNLADTPVAAER